MIIGNLGSAARAVVSGGGLLDVQADVPAGRPDPVSVAWWVGAEDRWHVPQQEITTRQSLVDDAPVVRTAVRVPGGDVSAVTYAAVQGPRELVVTDVENRSSTPVAVAFILQGLNGAVCDGSVVAGASGPLMYLSKRPAIRLGAPTIDELRAKLAAGAADEGPHFGSACVVAVVLPLAHIARTRVAVLMAADSDVALRASPVLSELPSGDTVAKGWAVQTRRAAELSGVGRVGERYGASLRSLLLASAASETDATPTHVVAALATALGRTGFTREARRLSAQLFDRADGRGGFGNPVSTAAVVVALSVAGWLGDGIGDRARDGVADGETTAYREAAAPVAARALESLRDRSVLGAARVAADLFRAADDLRAEKDCLRMWDRAGRPWPAPRPSPLPLPPSSAGGELVPDDPLQIAAHVIDALDQAVRVEPDGTIALLTSFDDSNRGVPVDVRRVPTPFGWLSFAVRWHGARPALLWETTAALGDLRLGCPILAPSWNGRGAHGDALL